MSNNSISNFKERTATEWAQIVARYRTPSHGRSAFEILITCIPFVVLWVLALYFYFYSYWLSLLFIIPAGFFLVRIFCIQHDCGHGSFFRNKALNDWIGRALSVFTLTPYDVWKKDHAAHHSTSGNLNKRGFGDITTLTIQEYQALTFMGKVSYRFYRSPFVMFLIGPTYLFFFRHRVPLGRMNEFKPWISAMATNLGIAAIGVGVIYFIGTMPFLIVHLPIHIIAGTVGVWLFYVQHQFEDTLWVTDDEWNAQHVGLYGSSYYDLPFFLRWATANIGVHHIHHLHSKVPYYRLHKILKDHPQLKEVSRITLWQSLRCVNLHLWDEANRKLISFRDRKRAKN